MRGMVKFGTAVVLSVALSVGLTGCGNPFSKTKATDDISAIATGDVLYESGLQYVKIVDRDVPGVANEHPVVISQDELRTVLESVYIQKSALFNDKQDPMFSAGELQILSSTMAPGFARLESNQDLVFVLLGAHRATISTETMTNSGRVFMSGGRLNIIFGKAHELFREKDPITNQPIDRRLNPLLPGTRQSEAELSVPIVLDQGQSFYVDPQTGKERRDWIVIDIPTVLAHAAEMKQQAGQGQLSQELLDDIARNKQENKNLRHDMANIKEVLFEMSEKLDRVTKELEQLKGQ